MDALDWASREQDLLLDLAKTGSEDVLHARLPSHAAQLALSRLTLHNPQTQFLDLLSNFLLQIDLDSLADSYMVPENVEWTNHAMTIPSVNLISSLVPALLGRRDQPIADFLRSLHATLQQHPQSFTLISLLAVISSALVSYCSSLPLDPIIARSVPSPDASIVEFHNEPLNQCSLFLRIISYAWIKVYEPLGWEKLVSKGLDSSKIANVNPTEEELENSRDTCRSSLASLKMLMESCDDDVVYSDTRIISCMDAVVDSVKHATILTLHGSLSAVDDWTKFLCEIPLDLPNLKQDSLYGRIHDVAQDSLSLIIRTCSSESSLINFIANYLKRTVQIPDNDFTVQINGEPNPVLVKTAKTLACALEYLSPSQDDIPISTAYALLNSSTSKYIASAAPSVQSESEFIQELQAENSLHISEHNIRRSSIISTTTVATHLTLHFRKKDMVRLVISMLLQRLRASSSTNSSNIEEENILIALVTNVSELATEASELELGDIVRALADVSHSHHSSASSIEVVNDVDGYYLVQDKVQSAILTAQTRIAKRVVQMSQDRPNLRSVYLKELLALFVDRSIRVHPERDPLEKKKHLISLILVIDALICDMPETDSELADNTSLNQSGVPDELVTLFRDFWFTVVLSDLCQYPVSINETPNGTSNNIYMAGEQLQALKRIATKTPCLVRATAVDYLERDLEYNSVLRKHSTSHSSTIDRQRGELAKAVPQNAGQIRNLSYPQTIFFLAVLTLETMRAEMLRPSTMLSYFCNEGINSTSLFNLLASIADQVNEKFRRSLNHQVVRHSIDSNVYCEIKSLLVKCCRPSVQIRKVSIRYVNSIVNAFPSLFCHEIVVNTGLEMLTILRRSCEASFGDQYSPLYIFESQKTQFRLVLPDDYSVRNEILVDISGSIRAWFTATISRAPMEMRGLLLAYIDHPNDETFDKDNLNSEMGKSIALDLARALPGTSKHADLPSWGGWKHDTTSSFVASFGTRKFFSGQAQGFVIAEKTTSKLETPKSKSLDVELHMPSVVPTDEESHALDLLKQDMRLKEEAQVMKPAEIRQLLYRAASALIVAEKPDHELLRRLVKFPISIFSPFSVSTATEVWAWLIYQRSELEERLMTEISLAWNWTIRRRKGFFSDSLRVKNPLEQETEYSPIDKGAINITYQAARRLFGPHHALIDFLSSRFQAFRYNNPKLLLVIRRLLHTSCLNAHKWNTHPLARELWNKVLLFGFAILQGSSCEAVVEYNFREAVYKAAFVWFENKARWSFGSNRIQLEADIKSLQELHNVVSVDPPSIDFWASAHGVNEKTKTTLLRRGLNVAEATERQRERQRLLLVFLESEIEMLNVWLNPLSDKVRGTSFKYVGHNGFSENLWKKLVHVAWSISPSLAVRLTERFPMMTSIAAEVLACVAREPHLAVHVPEGLLLLHQYRMKNPKKGRYKMRHILYWAPIPPISALRFFEPSHGGNDPILLQYAMRVMEQHPVPVTFFYIPQVVQALRIDQLGYVERFIFETAKISQLFCHQIIWNMKANFFKDDNAEIADPMKPMFERTVDMVVSSLSGEAKSFYEREFRFFDNVTSISKKLQPYVKKSKPEKKAKIDEEMSKIEVDVGVYLPSNPDGVVIDIVRKSGRPLQSHAKTPFMATFKIRKERRCVTMLQDGTPEYSDELETYEVQQSAIFKVGDDTRQDMLALQIIAQCKNIFMDLGLHLQVIPYRVVATGPGSGLIDVIPNSTSRDEMGRAKINDLTAFFIGKYGGPDTIAFQEARINFIQSMAAYSLLCYIIQIKDRHNGNIMIDGEGRICHVDFGFLFDIDK